jgi:hypothetical protein
MACMQMQKQFRERTKKKKDRKEATFLPAQGNKKYYTLFVGLINLHNLHGRYGRKSYLTEIQSNIIKNIYMCMRDGKL